MSVCGCGAFANSGRSETRPGYQIYKKAAYVRRRAVRSSSGKALRAECAGGDSRTLSHSVSLPRARTAGGHWETVRYRANWQVETLRFERLVPVARRLFHEAARSAMQGPGRYRLGSRSPLSTRHYQSGSASNRRAATGALYRRQSHRSPGRLADCFYLIESWVVEIIREVPGNAPEHLRVCSAGDTFGEMAMLSTTPRTATVRCLTAVDVLRFGRQNFLSLFAGYKAFRSRVQDTMRQYTK